jgi:hypothetical protein
MLFKKYSNAIPVLDHAVERIAREVLAVVIGRHLRTLHISADQGRKFMTRNLRRV